MGIDSLGHSLSRKPLRLQTSARRQASPEDRRRLPTRTPGHSTASREAIGPRIREARQGISEFAQLLLGGCLTFKANGVCLGLERQFVSLRLRRYRVGPATPAISKVALVRAWGSTDDTAFSAFGHRAAAGPELTRLTSPAHAHRA